VVRAFGGIPGLYDTRRVVRRIKRESQRYL